MSDSARPDLAAFHDLEQVVRALADTMSGWRRRALLAESRVREYEEREAAAGTPAVDPERLSALEEENARLRTQLASAGERTRQLLERVRFLRQQQEIEAER